MTQILKTITAVAVFSAGTAFAGTAMVGGGKCKTVCTPPPAGCSTEISYSSVELDWNHTFISQGGIDDVNGVGLKVEYSPISNLYLVGEGDLGWTSVDDNDVRAWGLLAGVGGYIPLTTTVHFATDIGGIWEGSRTDNNGRVSDGGWYVRPHLRAKFACAEIHLGGKFVCLQDFDNRFEIFGDVYYEIAPHFDLTIGAAVDLKSDDKDWSIKAGARYRF